MGTRGPKPKSRQGQMPGTRVCIRCKAESPETNFYKDKNRPDGLYPECKQCVREQRDAHYKSNRERLLATQARYNRRLREKVLNHYGHRCACCGETAYEFLGVDHIEGGGMRHLRELRGSSKSLLQWLIKNDFPPGFRLLCHNCNFARGHYGYCPHDGDSIRFNVVAAQPFISTNGVKPKIPPAWENKGGSDRSTKTRGRKPRVIV